MKQRRTILALLAVLTLVLLAGPARSQNPGELTWTTDDVHFDGYVLVIRGYFTNQTFTAVDRIHDFSVRVHLRRHDEWREHASATFDDLDIVVRPDHRVYHTFRIHGVEPRRFDEASVRWKVSYHWRGHGPEEFRHHEWRY